MNDAISIDNQTTFQCQCTPGYDGINCQFISDMCKNIICENNGRCFSSHLSWSCQCLGDSLYYGQNCEHTSSELVAKQILSKSFAFIAIIAIIAVYAFVTTMDILKYGFGIDPVDRERQRMALDKGKKSKTSKNKPKKLKHRSKSMQLFYLS